MFLLENLKQFKFKFMILKRICLIVTSHTLVHEQILKLAIIESGPKQHHSIPISTPEILRAPFLLFCL